jgi:hypothetical protein
MLPALSIQQTHLRDPESIKFNGMNLMYTSSNIKYITQRKLRQQCLYPSKAILRINDIKAMQK